MIKWIIALGFSCCAAAAASAQSTPPPPAVGIISAAQQPVYNQNSYVGRIQSPQIVQVSARVTGYLEQQNFKDGDMVKKGQVLYVIEQPPYQAAVEQAQATLESAQAQATNANLTLSRARTLLRTPAGQQSTVDAAAAQALSDKAQIDTAKAQLEIAQINLGYTRITSPLDGQIGATAVNTGNVVGPNSGTLATIVAQDPMYVTFSLPLLDALKLRQASSGQNALDTVDVIVKLPDGETYPVTGSIDFVNNQVTQTTDTLNMRATIANPLTPNTTGDQRPLYDGEFINVVLRDRNAQSQITVPRGAVISDQLGDYVLIVGADNVAQRQNVTMGQGSAQTVSILKGLKPGDHIIVDGIQRVHPGIKVNPQFTSPTPTIPSSGQE